MYHEPDFAFALVILFRMMAACLAILLTLIVAVAVFSPLVAVVSFVGLFFFLLSPRLKALGSLGLATTALVLVSCASAPHGEEKRGPHGGYIKMPGGFHVEAVPQGNDRLTIYLLDLASQEPLTLVSRLKGQLEQGGITQAVVCEPEADHYLCRLPAGSDLSSGRITIQAVRKERVERPATFELPFRVPTK